MTWGDSIYKSCNVFPSVSFRPRFAYLCFFPAAYLASLLSLFTIAGRGLVGGGVEVDGRTVVAGFLPQKPPFFQPHTSSLTKEWSAGCKISLGEYLVRYVWVDVLRNVWAKILKFHCHHLVGSSISSAFASPSSSWLIVAAAPLFSSSCS